MRLRSSTIFGAAMMAVTAGSGAKAYVLTVTQAAHEYLQCLVPITQGDQSLRGALLAQEAAQNLKTPDEVALQKARTRWQQVYSSRVVRRCGRADTPFVTEGGMIPTPSNKAEEASNAANLLKFAGYVTFQNDNAAWVAKPQRQNPSMQQAR